MRALAALLVLSAAAAEAREPIVGLPCEGCEAVFEGLPARLASHARIAPDGEPGEPLTLAGRVLAGDGARAGVVVYAYHTDAKGLYPPLANPPGDAAAHHGRLRGWAISDAEGRYRFDTIRPGSYPTRDMPAHIHMHVLEPGCSTYYIDDVLFTDDPLLTPAQRRAHANGRGGDGITTPVRADGRWQVTRDIRVGAGIPGHVACTGDGTAERVDAACAARVAMLVDPRAEPLAPARFVGIDRRLDTRAIVERLGPAARDVGSGLHVLEWDVSDGRRFLVSTTGACAIPVATGFQPPAPR
jgi:protocatechuate 3,4-dioxygenase beta subunit